MHVVGGDTNVSAYFQLELAAGGDATGLTITDFDLSYTRNGATTAAKADVTDLGSANAAHTDNGGYEVDATDCPGLHRFDFPDAAFAAGVRDVMLTIKHASCITATIRCEIDSYAKLNDESISELSQAQPSSTPTLRNAVMLLYMALRNKLDVTTSGTDYLEVHNNAGTVIAKKALTDSGGDYSEAKMETGP